MDELAALAKISGILAAFVMFATPALADPPWTVSLSCKNSEVSISFNDRTVPCATTEKDNEECSTFGIAFADPRDFSSLGWLSDQIDDAEDSGLTLVNDMGYAATVSATTRYAWQWNQPAPPRVCGAADGFTMGCVFNLDPAYSYDAFSPLAEFGLEFTDGFKSSFVMTPIKAVEVSTQPSPNEKRELVQVKVGSKPGLADLFNETLSFTLAECGLAPDPARK